jgi:hypothetical protein
MKTGKSLAEFASEIKRTTNERRDFISPTTKLHYEPDDGNGVVAFKAKDQRTNRVKAFAATPTNYCLRQICERSGIPAKYVDKMKGEHADCLAQNINYWWQNKSEPRMLRTLLNGSHRARAFVSDVYRPLENADLAAIILPKLADLDCEVLSCEITETRLYIQAATPKLEAKLVGDRVRCGMVASNSEVGAGAISLEPLLYYLRCLNGMVMPVAMRRYHIGKREPMMELDNAAEYYTDKTKEMDDRVFWSKVKDVVDGLFDRDRFTAMVDAFEGTTKQKVKGTDAVEEVTARYQLSQQERDDVLNNLIEGGDSTLFGLINAVTRTASDVESYDRSVELQRIGGRLIELPASTWR